MNLLAHLWLADRSDTSPAGQTLGDIVKGRMARDRFGPAVDRGIRIHRRIDSHCDDHPVHRELRRRFEPPLRRYAGIIVDIGFDHALARRWRDFSDEPLAAFAQRIARQIENQWPATAPRGAPAADSLARLLVGYTQPAGIDRALRSVSQRLRRHNPLDQALTALLAEYPQFAAGLAPLLYALEQTANRTW